MTRDPDTVSPDTPVWEAAKIIVESKFGCLPVVNEDGYLVGIVTEHDFVKTIAE
jgi:CBS domain-containing protein